MYTSSVLIYIFDLKMKDKNFKIKIWDLLHNIGSSDDVHFEKKFLDDLTWLDEEGISGDINLQSLNNEALYCTLLNVSCKIVEDCDTCAKTYTREVKVPDYTAKFVLWDISSYTSDKSDEEVFQIDSKDEFIDLEEMVKQAIVLKEPIVKHCKKCEKELESVDDDEELPYLESKSNITFEL